MFSEGGSTPGSYFRLNGRIFVCGAIGSTEVGISDGSGVSNHKTHKNPGKEIQNCEEPSDFNHTGLAKIDYLLL